MAAKNFRSTLLEPTSEFAKGDRLRFTALSTSGSVFNSSFSEITIGDNGQYSVDLQYGKYRIDYKPYEGVWQKFADVEVSASTLATSLQSLALSSKPVTDDTILTLQSLLADAEDSAAIAAGQAAAATNAANSAESAKDSVINAIESTDFWKTAGVNGEDSDIGSSLIFLLLERRAAGYYVENISQISLKCFMSDQAPSSALFFPNFLYPPLSSGASALFSTTSTARAELRFFIGSIDGIEGIYCAAKNKVANNSSITVTASSVQNLSMQKVAIEDADVWSVNNAMQEIILINIQGV